MEECPDLEETVLTALQHILDQIYAEGNDGDLVNIRIDHDALDTPIHVGFSPRRKLTALRILMEIKRRQQSKKNLKFDSGLRLTFQRIHLPTGGRPAQKVADWQVWFDKHCGHGGCFLKIQNQDQKCFPRAVVTAIAHLQRGGSEEMKLRYNYMRLGRKLQEEEADKLLRKAGLGGFKDPCGPHQWKQVEKVLLPHYGIRIWSKDYCNGLIYKGQEGESILHLYHYDGHFAVITKLAAFLNRGYACEECNVGYGKKGKHICEQRCFFCKQPGRCPTDAERVYCPDCNFHLPSRQCYENHKREYVLGKGRKRIQKEPVCGRVKRCEKCGQKVDLEAKKKHRCGVFKCRWCKQLVENDPSHQFSCYMQPVEKKKKGRENKDPDDVQRREQLQDGELDESDEDFMEVLQNLAEEHPEAFEEEDGGGDFEGTFIFFDFECYQSREMERDKHGNPVFAHDPNYCVVHKVCDLCKHDDEVWKKHSKRCPRCRTNRLYFEGDNCRNEFASWLFSGENKGCIALAHNAKGYDSQFLLKYLAEQGIDPSKGGLIRNGTEIIRLRACGVMVKDSKAFLPMPLSALPKSFQLKELKKGYFPYHFDTPEHADYVGPWPDAKYYKPEGMKPTEKAKFEDWYEQQKGKEFNMREEKATYCESDVQILREGDMHFRDLFKEETGVDPLVEATTIASACMLVYRRNYLQRDTIALVPPGGYRRHEKQSVKALKLLKWKSETEGIRIQHARNGQELRAGPYKVDGYCEETNTCFEFHGCFYHGCPKCYKDRNLRAGGNQTMEAKYQRTLEKKRYLENLGYKYSAMWECELEQQLKEDPEMAAFFKRTEVAEPLDPRHGFFGGRTNPIWLYYRVKDDEKVHYVDICSLYPWVCKYGVFPVGHPTILTENFEPISKENQPYFGLMKLDILPPQKLFHPVLPHRSPEGKLCFPLCRTCCDTQQKQETCPHTEEERTLKGTWVSLEVYKALEMGYQVRKVHEVWHYKKRLQYDGTPGSGLFDQYINPFLKMKQEASGWPGWVKTEEDRQRYLEEYEKKEGICLDAEKIERNEGRRSLAKLMLNSFWGKFGQRTSLKKSILVTDLEKFYKILTDDSLTVDYVTILTEEAIMLTVSAAEEEFQEILPNTNPVIAAFVTAQARLKLYSYMEQLGERVLYTDTDSIVYVTHADDVYEVPIGNFLGDMTNELADYGEGAGISEYISTGPKSYAYAVKKSDGSTACAVKSKGFTLDYQTGQILNMEKMKQMVFKYVEEGAVDRLEIESQGIRRTKAHDVVTLTVKKTFGVTANKRKFLDNSYMTYPYGYMH